jgi:hypothetical protein
MYRAAGARRPCAPDLIGELVRRVEEEIDRVREQLPAASVRT